MKGTFVALFEILFALSILSFNFHWAFIVLCVFLIPWGILWAFVALLEGDDKKAKG